MKSFRRQTTHTLLAVWVSSVALILSSAFSSADTPPPDVQAAFSRPEETLDHAFQPPDGDILHRYRFLPATGGPKWPTVLMLPPDVFYLQYGDHGVASERWATHDLQSAGFLVFQVDHRLAPGDGQLPGQTSSGYAPDQTDDIKRQILAALADPQCNGTIYLVGGSAGGCLALWCALDPASTVSGWNEGKRAQIKAVVSLSGPTDFCDDRNLGGIPSDAITKFENALDNYVGLPDQTFCDNDPDQKLNHASPAWLVTNGATSSPPAVRLYATDGDTVPYAQEDDMFTALFTRYNTTIDLVKYRMSYQYTDRNHHAYTYWHSINDDPNGGNERVSQQVINFLLAHP